MYMTEKDRKSAAKRFAEAWKERGDEKQETQVFCLYAEDAGIFGARNQFADYIRKFPVEMVRRALLDLFRILDTPVADLMRGTYTRAALVSTNSVSQGESVAVLWKPLFEAGVEIDFAHRTFRWDSEAHVKAHVHCVIVGFSFGGASGADRDGARSLPADAVGRVGSPSRPHATTRPKLLFTDGKPQVAKNINGYLLDADNVFVESRSKPLCDVPEIGIGNKPIDGGFYLFTEEEKDAFIKGEPQAAKYFRPWIGSHEFINRYFRHCLWLGECPPNELRKMPACMKRIEAVRNFRLASPSAGTVKLADKPTRFHVENMPQDSYIVVPKVSSERRRYVPMGMMCPNVLASDLVFLIPDASLYHFGVLTSSVHMAWMRAVAGRLKSDYRYSINIVYNNFPWPDGGDSAYIGRPRGRGRYGDASVYNNFPWPDGGGSACTGRPRGRGRYGDGGSAGGRLGEPTLPETPNPDNPENPCDPHLCGFASLREKITETAQAILDARALYPDASLADLYDERTMPPELRKAHRENDRAVLAAYGLPHDISEPEIVAHLMGQHQALAFGTSGK